MKAFKNTRYAAIWLAANATGPASVLLVHDKTWTVPDILALARTPWVWGA